MVDPIHKRAEIPTRARYLYMYLRDYAYEHKTDDGPGIEQVARDLGVSRYTVMRWINALESAGLVHSHRRGLGLTNTYTIYEPEAV